MSYIPFDDLPDHARLWIFGADRDLSGAEQTLLLDSVKTGLSEWNAHGSPVRWGHRIEHDRFLMIGVDETHTALSGCSIDSAVGRIRDLEVRLGQSLLDNARVFYRKGEAIVVTDRPTFRSLAEEGAVDAGTPVFNNVIATVGELRQDRWEVPAGRSWHAKAFPVRSA